jgi:hypothetical protein
MWMKHSQTLSFATIQTLQTPDSHAGTHRTCQPPLRLCYNYCFLWAVGPISLLKAKYETSKLDSAFSPTNTMMKSGKMPMKPMKRGGDKN